MLFEFEKQTVNIDVEATRNYYKEKKPINDCSCPGCRNYRQYIKEQCSNKIKEFFAEIGIDDMNCITEIIPLGAYRDDYEKDNCLNYMGFYHVKGEIIESQRDKYYERWTAITESFHVSIHDEIALLPDGFPTPCVQAEIKAYIPWVLNEENEYIV